MSGDQKTPKEIWKFLYWPVVWFLVFLPGYLLKDIWSLTDVFGIWLSILGIVVLAWGFSLHITAGKTLKKMGHTPGHRSIWPNRLVKSGIYSCMRHPEHLGLAIVPFGIALLLNSLVAILSSGWAILAAFFFVAVIEEPECIEKFGEDYFEYMESTPAFSLRPGCLAKGLRELRKT